ncbi:MAG: ribosomal-processing cysteine protease Prp [Tissierellia bacterium]|nr:ribosomal-processing cysteine protease Prp [Tissierellia bacterium]
MISVYIYRDKNSSIKKIEMTGHADFGFRGDDIVCASASFLSYTLLNYLIEVLELDESQLHYEINEELPYFLIEIKNDESAERAKQGLEFYEIGIVSLVEHYSDNVDLLYREV